MNVDPAHAAAMQVAIADECHDVTVRNRGRLMHPLVGGQEVPKDDARIEAYGTVDELNAFVGTARVTLAEALAGAPAGSTEPLMSHHAEYEARMAEALAFTRPTFNEEMRGGHTNM